MIHLRHVNFLGYYLPVFLLVAWQLLTGESVLNWLRKSIVHPQFLQML